MNSLLVLPIIVPLSTAIASLLLWNSRRAQRLLSLVGATGLLASAIGLFSTVWHRGIQSAQIGNWPAPFGITLVADLFAAIMVVMAGLTAVAVTCYSLSMMDSKRESFGYYPLFHIMLMGVCGSFLTGDIFNLYVWFEVMLIASFVLLELGGERAQLEGAIKYVAINLISSAFFLTAIAVLYGMVGTLNMADIAQQVNSAPPSGPITTVALLFLLAFGIKAAAFPLFFWLPSSYHTPPAPVSSIFAALLTKVGVYALIRVFTLIFIQDTETTHGIILVIAGLTMLTGVLGAMAQNDFRRLLSFHIVSQIGYMLMGLGLFTSIGLVGSIFHIIHNIFAKTNLFLVSGIAYRLKGSYDLKKLGGLYRSFPILAFLFLIPAFALAGLPPLAGFWSKLILIKAGLAAEDYLIVAVALLVSLLTAYSMTKIWNEAFLKKEPPEAQKVNGEAGLQDGLMFNLCALAPIVMLAALTLIMGLAAEPTLAVIQRAADQLMNPSEYIAAVLGGST